MKVESAGSQTTTTQLHIW